MATATKTTSVIQDWDPISGGSVGNYGVSGAGVLTSCLQAGLMVTVCPIEAVANALGALVTVEGRFGGNNEDFHDLYTLRMGAGTASLEAVEVEAASGQRTIELASTTDFETLGDKYLVHNTVSEPNSEVVRNAGFDNDVDITVVSNLQNTQQVSANLYNIVNEKFFPLPEALSLVRVHILNDDTDCDVLWRVDLILLTAVG